MIIKRNMIAGSSIEEQWQQQRKRRKIRRLLFSSYDNGKALDRSTDKKLTIGDLKLIAGSCYLPKESNSKPEGEDAHFIRIFNRVIGVADGVGGWAKYGIDAGKYARELMHNSTVAIHDEPVSGIDPLRVLRKAYLMTKEKGSSTACIIAFTNKMLYAAYVGDSGFMVIREENIVYYSPIQQRRFNCPYQLGRSDGSDCPSSAEVIQIPIQAGDVVVAGTDGLFDNLYRHEIADIVNKGFRNDMKPRDVAGELALTALDVSKQTDCPTPFAQASAMAGGKHRGGKYDDITVIVAHIVTAEEYFKRFIGLK